MNYIRIYDELCNRSKSRILVDYTETHHIIPKCMGGSDDANNLVELTPEEHYVAHQLLIKIYPKNKKLIYAAQLMCYGHQKRMNNKLFGWLKRQISNDRKNNNPSSRDDVKRKISESLKGNIPWNKGLTGCQVAWNRGIPHTEVTKQRMKENHWLRNGGQGSFTGKSHTQQTKNQISKKLKDIGIVPPSKKGWKPSDETLRKMKIGQQNRRLREYEEKSN